MIPRFSEAERAIQYPPDRRLRVSMKPGAVYLLAVLTLGPAVAAWIQYLASGLPSVHVLDQRSSNPGDPQGFPAWACVSHWVNFFFMTLMMRSGLSILMDHPRLYWNDHCTPDTEWIRLTPLKVPDDRVWTAKDDARYLPPLIGLPGYRHTIGLARVWHFLAVPFFVLNGLIFIGLLFLTSQWKRLVPASWDSVPQAWSVFVHYVTFHRPPEPNGFYQFNPLQQVSYFCVLFVMAPLSMLTGLAMSPALESRLPWYGRLFGGRQGARSLHFLLLLSYLGFTAVHVSMISITGFTRNMNHITRGTDDSALSGMLIGLGIVGVTVASWFVAHWLSWRRARALQHLSRTTEGLLRGMSLSPFKPREHYTLKDISPYFWPNGKLPTSGEWLRLAEGDFKEFKLKIGGMVENPVELTLADLERLGKEEHVTMHHCIQGWTGIAQWGGVSLQKIVDLVKPKQGALTLAFISFGEGLYGGAYYDTQTLEDVLKPQSILAWEMNGRPLPRLHGAPLRLRVENQLGYKMVKWIRSMEFVESPRTLGKGEGGTNEDDEYFDLNAKI